MNARKTCDKCKHYKSTDMPNSPTFQFAGSCALIGDSNNGPTAENGAAGWDYASYRAGVYIGPKFGCIHWIKKETK